MSKNCIIMRGAPGSGKTTFLHRIFPEFANVSADRHRMVKKEYVFKAEDNARIHNLCLQEFTDHVRNNLTSLIAVDNTNIKIFELAPYYRLAECHGYTPYIFYLPYNADLAHQRNTHQVPLDVVRLMANGVEPIPSFWTQHIITPDVPVSKIRQLVFPGEK